MRRHIKAVRFHEKGSDNANYIRELTLFEPQRRERSSWMLLDQASKRLMLHKRKRVLVRMFVRKCRGLRYTTRRVHPRSSRCIFSRGSRSRCS